MNIPFIDNQVYQGCQEVDRHRSLHSGGGGASSPGSSKGKHLLFLFLLFLSFFQWNFR